MLPLGAAPAGAAPADNNGKSIGQLQREREEVRRKAAAQASEVNVLEATDAQVTRALEALNANVRAQQDRVEEAERAVATATAEQEAAEAEQARKEAELEEIRQQMSDSAVEAYVTMGSGDVFSTLDSDDINDTVNKRTLLSMRANENVDLAERFRSVQEDLEIQRAAAESAAERAREQRSAVRTRLSELNDAYAEQQAFAEQVEQRIESALAEADALASIDTQLSGSINAKQAEIARAMAAQRAAEEARAKAREAQNRAALAPPAPSSSGGGGSTSAGGGGSSSGGGSTSGGGGGSTSGGGGGGGRGGTPPAITGAGEIVNVGGIRVHRSIAGNLQRLLADAAAAGINFGGGGYRDPAGQIAVRRNNCGSSHYAIYEMPASQCRPPTARPGSSMHERGLAIDFTVGGRTLTRGSAGFNWLAANAARYGLYNLPVEPWHWSTNGN